MPCNIGDKEQNEDKYEHEQRKVLNIESPDDGSEDKADAEEIVDKITKSLS